MDNSEAQRRALKALRSANEHQLKAYVEHGGGWGDWDTSEIVEHIEEWIAYEFKRGPKPEDLT